jgi:hypothetical protein
MIRIFVALAICLLSTGAVAGSVSADELMIVTAGGQRHRFDVEVAVDPKSQMRGLMFRQSLAPDAGMLFPFEPEQSVAMWMKNTLIPLDIIFIAGDGRIRNIVERAQPGDTSLKSSDGPVRAVLEVNGGIADRLQIRAGDQVRHAVFSGAK